ncbi:hypothetical protein [Agrobacterium tumefaciens]
MSSHNPKIEVLSSPERRRRWSMAEKLAGSFSGELRTFNVAR